MSAASPGLSAFPPIKGAWIDGGYVIVTPAGRGPDKAPALKAAILAAAKSAAASDLSAEPECCPRCNGDGTDIVMSDGGPDAYEVTVDCPHCKGNQTLRAAYDGVVELLEQSEKKYHEAAAILYLGRAHPTAASRLTELAEYAVKPNRQDEWLRDRLLGLADMASVVSPVAAHSAASSPTALDHFIADVEAAGSEKPQPLTKTKVINIINKLRNKYPYPGGNGLRFDIELARAIEAAHGIYPSPAAMKGEQS